MRYVLCQISTDLINADKPDDIAARYYRELWRTKAQDGYWKSEHFWELPLWIGEATAAIEHYHIADLHVVTETDMPLLWYDELTADFFLFSVLEVNKAIVRDIVKRYPDCNFVLGGYVDPSYFDGCPNAVWYDSIRAFSIAHFGRYTQGLDWRLFEGEKTIPRLTLSEGCSHRCRFCCVPNKVECRPDENIMAQIDAMRPLRFRLVYLNDKTFGQADNHWILLACYDRLRRMNPDFQGFIVQTTAQQVLKKSRSMLGWYDCGVRVVELGLESANDDILRHYRKPHNVRQVSDAIRKLQAAGIRVICNVVVGFPEETDQSYSKTLEFIDTHDLYALNIYNLALYAEADLADDLKSQGDADSDELSTKRSYFTGDEQRTHDNAYDAMFWAGLRVLRMAEKIS